MIPEKPRPIEFMLRGYTVAQMRAILDRWDALTESERGDLGFTCGPECALSKSVPAQSSPHSLARPQPALRVVNGCYNSNAGTTKSNATVAEIRAVLRYMETHDG